MPTVVHAPRNGNEALILERWGIESFRPLQREAIEANLNGRDSLVVMPTGSGKSLCYQAPAALYHSGLTLVISPLISLMKDQVDSLQCRDVPAAFLNSSQHVHEQQEVEKALHNGDLRLLYVSPERVLSPSMISLLNQCRVDAIIIDEAHCISQWGHDFRPAYAELGNLRKVFPSVPIHCFTATATPGVCEQIIEQLGLDAVAPVVLLIGDFDRPNLTLRIEDRTNLDRQLLDFIRRRPGQAGIVYCITRAETERIREMLVHNGVGSLPYHAGMDDATREVCQQTFMARQCDVVVATIAFGMGIDRPDVRWIIHAGMPSSIEMYHQEIGRAGRDGQPAECTLLYHTNDLANWAQVLENEGIHGNAHSRKSSNLMAMDDFCMSETCRHDELALHFGQALDLEANCGACDVCLESNERKN